MNDKNTLYLAQQWANLKHYNWSEGSKAAADLISSLPDTIVDGGKLREVINAQLDSHPHGTVGHHVAEDLACKLQDLLPDPALPTLADMSPEERAECQWMQAEVDGQAYEGRAVITDLVEGGSKAKTILPSGQQFSFHISIVTPLPDLPRMEWPGSEPEADDTREPEEDERVTAWEEIVKHRFFRDCFNTEGAPLLDNMNDKLDFYVGEPTVPVITPDLPRPDRNGRWWPTAASIGNVNINPAGEIVLHSGNFRDMQLHLTPDKANDLAGILKAAAAHAEKEKNNE